MVYKFTRGQKFYQLTALNSEGEVEMENEAFEKLIIDVTNSGAIRVQINGEPSDFDDETGYLVSFEKPLILYDHVVESIKYIRESDMTFNVDFQILGLKHNK